jgi:hypothetical protein
VCWRSEVQDVTAKRFALDFYASLKDQGQARDYTLAFQQAVVRMSEKNHLGKCKSKKYLHADAVDYVCLLSQDGDEFPDTGHICVR